MRSLLFLLFLCSTAISQVGIFTGYADITRLSDATEIEGELIYYNANWEGTSTLFVAGDEISGTASVDTVKFQLFMGVSTDGDQMWSEKFVLGTVGTAFLDETFESGTVTGETFILGTNDEWTDASGVKFFVVGSGTQEVDILAIFKQGK